MRVFLLVALLACAALAAQKKGYDDVCEEMIEHAQLAAQAHNRGNTKESDRQVRSVSRASSHTPVESTVLSSFCALFYIAWKVNADDIDGCCGGCL
jgi:hypothetical protein